MILKNSNCTDTKKKCDKTQKLKLCQNSKTQIVTKFKNSKFGQKSNCDKTQKFKILPNSNSDKT